MCDDKQHPSRDRRVPVALGLIILLGAALRLYHLGHYSLWYDEAATLFMSRYADLQGSLFQFEKTTEPPLMAVLTFLWYGFVQALTDVPVISQTNDFLLRLLPCIFGIAGIPLTFATARVLLGKPGPALLAAFLFAISPFQVYYAQELRIYSFLAAMGLIAVYCTYRALETGHWKYWIGFVVAETVMMYSHFITVWFIFTMNLWFLAVAWVYRRHFGRWIAANALLLILITPSLIMGYRMASMVEDLWPPWYPQPTLKITFITFKNLIAWYGFTPWAYWPLFLIAMGFVMLGLVSMRRRWKVALLLGMLVFVPIAANLVLWRVREFSFYEHRLFIISGVAALIVIAQGMAALKHPVLIVPALAVFTVFTGVCLRDMYADRLHPLEIHRLGMWHKVDFRAATKHIEDSWQGGDGVFVASHFHVYSLKHYLDKPVTRLGADEADAADYISHMGNEPLLRRHGLIPVPVADAVQDVERVWFLQSFGITFETQSKTEEINQWLSAHMRLLDEREFDGLRVFLFAW
jgi:uncharacterized membrane protein